MPNCPASHVTASRLDAENRKHLALEVLAKKQPVTRIAERNNVSRKFLYHQAAKANAALDKAFEGKTKPDEVLFYLPVTQSWLCQFVLALVLICRSSIRGVVELLRVLSASVRARFFFAGRASAAMASFEWAGRTAGHWRL